MSEWWHETLLLNAHLWFKEKQLEPWDPYNPEEQKTTKSYSFAELRLHYKNIHKLLD